MNLKDILKKVKYKVIYGIDNREVRGISCNSKDCNKDYIFVAIKGFEVDGHNFIKQAVLNGASVVFYEAYRGIDLSEFYGKGITFVKVSETRKVYSQLCSIFYGYPCKDINLIGITGTNGKTTITYLLEAILGNCGIIGTVNYRFQDNIYDAPNTTPDSCIINKILKEFKEKRAKFVAMEVSSHAMEMSRVEGIDFNIGVFTNLTSEHLDFHKHMENYFNAKKKFFTEILTSSSKQNVAGLINIDDLYGERLFKELKDSKIKLISYSLKNKEADIYVKKYKTSLKGSEIEIVKSENVFKINTNLIGEFNIYNIAAAVGVADFFNISYEKIAEAFKKEITIPGRLEKVINGKNIFVDYAHTEDALKNVLLTLNKLRKNKSKIITVFGCGGERDKSKRPKMGEVAAKYSDFIVVTSDNPRREDPLQIIDDILQGVKGNIDENNYRVIPDRKDAIEMSLKLAKNGDIVLIAGKGHEDYQILGKEKIKFSDKEVVLKFYNKGKNV